MGRPTILPAVCKVTQRPLRTTGPRTTGLPFPNEEQDHEPATALTSEPSCKDEAREGQKGRTGHRWFTRGERPPGRCDKRCPSTYIFAAVRSATDDGFALVMPDATAATMDEFLARFAETLPEDEHAALVLDQAGWHTAKASGRPSTSPSPPPTHPPELNPRSASGSSSASATFPLRSSTQASRPWWTVGAVWPGKRSAPSRDGTVL